VITTAWPVISATLSDPEPGSGVQPLSATLIVHSEEVTPQVNTTSSFAYTPTLRLAEGVHTVTAQVYDQAGNQAQSGPWSFAVSRGTAPSLGITKYHTVSGNSPAVHERSVGELFHKVAHRLPESVLTLLSIQDVVLWHLMPQYLGGKGVAPIWCQRFFPIKKVTQQQTVRVPAPPKVIDGDKVVCYTQL
jgi:hypothetical protein